MDDTIQKMKAIHAILESTVDALTFAGVEGGVVISILNGGISTYAFGAVKDQLKAGNGDAISELCSVTAKLSKGLPCG